MNTIKNKINKILSGPIVGFDTSNKYLAELGVSTNQDGTLELNEQTFNSKFDKNTSVFNAIFNSMYNTEFTISKGSIFSWQPDNNSVIYTYKSESFEKSLSSSASVSTPQTIVWTMLLI